MTTTPNDPCAVCGVPGHAHGVGDNFTVDHPYEVATPVAEQPVTDTGMSGTEADIEHRRSQFLALIRAYSEDRYAAGWMNGIEEDIRATGGVWTFIAFGCGGWPIGYEGEDGWAPFTDHELAVVTTMDGLRLTVEDDQ